MKGWQEQTKPASMPKTRLWALFGHLWNGFMLKFPFNSKWEAIYELWINPSAFLPETRMVQMPRLQAVKAPPHQQQTWLLAHGNPWNESPNVPRDLHRHDNWDVMIKKNQTKPTKKTAKQTPKNPQTPNQTKPLFRRICVWAVGTSSSSSSSSHSRAADSQKSIPGKQAQLSAQASLAWQCNSWILAAGIFN